MRYQVVIEKNFFLPFKRAKDAHSFCKGFNEAFHYPKELPPRAGENPLYARGYFFYENFVRFMKFHKYVISDIRVAQAVVMEDVLYGKEDS